MKRRAFLSFLGVVAVWPLVAHAQQPAKVYRVGCIPGGPLAPRAHQWDAFRQALRELSWREGHNIILEFRPPAQESDPFDELVAELVRLQVDVIVATGTRAVRTAKQATNTIPIVMSAAPSAVEEGLVASLARPGGNITGLSSMQMDLNGKRLEILREIVPRASRVAVLWAQPTERQLGAVRATARVLGVELLELQVTQAGDLEHAFEIAKRDRADALLVIATTLFFGFRARIADLALHHRLPAIYPLPSYTHSGGLVSYGQSDTEYYRQAAVYVDKILKGAKPEELPVQQPTKFELLINLKTAKAIGLEVPPILLTRADEVIE
jgi:putative tryptophan/tyrosine transport system substrate-binding protein